MTNLEERIAELTAHRACGNQEQDAANGKLAGYCVVCQVQWPCSYAMPRRQPEVNIARHGSGHCTKRMHNPDTTGYLHNADDDTPYDVDGLAYCGRCHVAL